MSLVKAKGRTIRNNRRGGDFYQNKIPARKTCRKKNPASGCD